MPYTDLNTIHDPATGTIAPASWGDQIRTNQEHFANDHDHFTNVGAGGGGMIGLQRLGQTVLGSPQGSISITGLNQTYSALLINVMLKAVTDNVLPYMTFNGDTGANYEYDRHGVISTGQNQFVLLANNMGNDANKALATAFIVPQYTTTVLHKTVSAMAIASVNLSGQPSGERWVGRWTSTAAINRVDVSMSVGNLDTGSAMSIYGLK